MVSSRLLFSALLCPVFLFCPVAAVEGIAQGPLGYYQAPALSGEDLYFTAEGDIWRVGLSGGRAVRVTSHPGTEDSPAVSPDGRILAFTATYEGPAEVYSMPVGGGVPTRHTWLGARRISVAGWTPDGRIIATTDAFSSLPQTQVFLIDPKRAAPVSPASRLPLAQAADGSFDDAGRIFFFTRFPFQGSHTKRYQGGTAQSIWQWTEGAAEAVPLTADYAGTSREPMWWKGRIVFVSDRDGTLNLWSMKQDGTDRRQLTFHRGWEVLAPTLSLNRVVYQLGADLRCLNLDTGADVAIPITLDSDLDQTRARWISKPLDYLSAVHLSPDGDRVVMTARGAVFTAPARQGRLVQVTRKSAVRYRNARFMPDGKNIVTLSDESGETEFWLLPANGTGPGTPLTKDADILRWDGLPSPDGKRLAHTDKNQRLWVLDLESKANRQVDASPVGDIEDLAWSPDSQWLAYAAPTANTFREIRVWSAADGSIFPVTSDRYDNFSPAWSPDGKWLYLLSSRNLVSRVPGPWGLYAPQPYFDRPVKVFMVALQEGLRSPFAPKDELQSAPAPVREEPVKKASETAKDAPAPAGGGTSAVAPPTAKAASAGKPAPAPVKIERKGIRERILEAPAPPGNYTNLAITDKALFWLAGGEGKRNLQSLSIAQEGAEVKVVAADVRGYELSADGKKLLIRKAETLSIVDAGAGPADLDKKDVPLAGWSLPVVPRDEWRQMLAEAWRLERDYFYDPKMHGVDWKAVLDKYLPLADRITSRGELSALLAQMVSELSALHIYVYGGDFRKGPENVAPAFLGAEFAPAPGGCRVTRLRRYDPDEPASCPPLARPDVHVAEGDVIEAINGVPTLAAPDPSVLLSNQAGKQVLLRVVPAAGGAARDVVVVPITAAEDAELRYAEWEYTRRLAVEEAGAGKIGYVHLRAATGADYTQWARDFFPVFTRDGLILDVRHNRGGNIDSWILTHLMKKAWFHWSQRVGQSPTWDMQYAFRGHVVVICDEFTASDGEILAEGIRRLGIGAVIGTRTWGGEIWLSSDNFLIDGGIATAAETGVYGPEGKWLIEGHGVDPDQVVDNLPHATFLGRDAQLEAAVAHLKRLIQEKPPPPVVIPPYPDKSWREKAKE